MEVDLYARQSVGDASVEQQLALGQAYADEHGHRVVGRFADRSISATSGARRPDYEAMMRHVHAGGAQGIIVRHFDRLYRSMRELEDVIDATEGLSIMAVRGGGYDLGTADGRAHARGAAAYARGEVEKKAERQKDANERDAEAGKPRLGCPRPFGWLEDRVTAHPQESLAVVAACHALLSGGTVAGVCRDWAERGVRPAQAPFGPLRRQPWTWSSVTTILRGPRIAGISCYDGEERGRGTWEALVPEDTWRAVVRVLDSHSRPHTAGVRSLLGGIAHCTCGNYVTSGTRSPGRHHYRCNPVTRNGRDGPHVSVGAAPVDDFVGELVIGRLLQPDAALLIAPKDDGREARELHEEAEGIRSRMGTLGPALMAGRLSEQDVATARRWGEERLAQIAERMTFLGRESVLVPLLAAGGVRAAWEGLPTDRRRAVVSALMEVTLHPAGRGARTFSAATVLPEGAGIHWRDQLRATDGTSR